MHVFFFFEWAEEHALNIVPALKRDRSCHSLVRQIIGQLFKTLPKHNETYNVINLRYPFIL